MNNLRKFVVISLMGLVCTNCASIVSKSNWPFSVDTTPSGAKVVIANKRGDEVYRGRTPAAMKLKSGAGFFAKESYVVILSMDGYETQKINVECKINGWYFGNIIFGGLIGLLIVDPATGAMYRLDSTGIDQSLTKTMGTTASLSIFDKNQIPKSWEQYLVKIN